GHGDLRWAIVDSNHGPPPYQASAALAASRHLSLIPLVLAESNAVPEADFAACRHRYLARISHADTGGRRTSQCKLSRTALPRTSADLLNRPPERAIVRAEQSA